MWLRLVQGRLLMGLEVLSSLSGVSPAEEGGAQPGLGIGKNCVGLVAVGGEGTEGDRWVTGPQGLWEGKALSLSLREDPSSTMQAGPALNVPALRVPKAPEDPRGRER